VNTLEKVHQPGNALTTVVSLVSPFIICGDVLKFKPRCAPVFIWNLSLVTILYLPQKRNDQGFAASENRRSGSKVSLFFPIAMLNITAGLPNEKLGTIEMPLLVTPTEPKKLPLFFVLSVSCEKVESVRCKSAKESNVVLIIFSSA
jgi:hypothetical protein